MISREAASGAGFREITPTRFHGGMPTLVGPAVPLDVWRGDGQPTLVTGDLRVRPWGAGDAETIVRAYGDPAIQRWHVQSVTATEAERWIDDRLRRWSAGTGADWAVVADDGAVLGRIGLRQVDLFEGEAEVAYWVLPEARGRAVAPRSLTALTEWAFATGLHRIALRHSVRNEASCRVADHAGFELEGTMRRAGRHADGDHDMHLHSRIADAAPTS